MRARVEAPIFVIGTHRSGTTLLGRAMAQHPQVAYWEEPRHVWSWGNNFRRDDLLTAADVTPRIRAHVQRCFRRFLESRQKPRLAEKTPSNCLRLGFIEEIFADALFVHIFRDGRAVMSSTAVMTRTRMPEAKWYLPRLLGTPIWEWPALVPRAWRTLGRRLIGKDMAFWGPRPPGWRDWLEHDAPLEVLAKQWLHTLEPVLEWRQRTPASRWLEVRYEDLVTDPARHAEEIQRFARLTPSRSFVDHLVGECRPDRVDAWRTQLDPAALEQVRPLLEPPLERLGYAW